MGKTNIYRLELNIRKCKASPLFWKDFINVWLAELQAWAGSLVSPGSQMPHTPLSHLSSSMGFGTIIYAAAAHGWHYSSSHLEALHKDLVVIVTTEGKQ